MKIIIEKKYPPFKKAPVSLVEFSHLRQVPGTLMRAHVLPGVNSGDFSLQKVPQLLIMIGNNIIGELK